MAVVMVSVVVVDLAVVAGMAAVVVDTVVATAVAAVAAVAAVVVATTRGPETGKTEREFRRGAIDHRYLPLVVFSRGTEGSGGGLA